MKAFTDAKGRSWEIELNIRQMKRVRDILGVDLVNVIQTRSDGSIATDTIDRVANDPILLCDILWVLCEQQAKADGVTDEDFGRAMSGDAILGATDALLDEIVDFFPNPKRAILQRLVAAARRAETAAKAALDKALSTDELDKAVDSLLAGSTGSSTNSPASAG